MKPYLVITAIENNRISKYLEFDNTEDANISASEKQAFVYHNTGNHWYKELWVEGETVTVSPLAKANPVINVSSNQLMRALIELNLYDSIDSAVTASNNKEVQVLWNRASSFSSDDHMVLTMGQAIGKTEDEIYQVFQLAMTK